MSLAIRTQSDAPGFVAMATVIQSDLKAIGINLFIGKRPIAAFGNSGNSDFSSGDAQMLEER